MLAVHQEIKPVRCWVPKKLFFNMNEEVEGMEKCDIFAISSYKGENLSLNVMALDTKSMFCDIPVWGVYAKDEEVKDLDPDDLCYDRCPDFEIAVNQFEYLQGSCQVYFKEYPDWRRGEYIATIDWHKDNLNCHFIRLDEGQFCFMPTHKIWWSGQEPPEKPPEYEKKRYSNIRN